MHTHRPFLLDITSYIVVKLVKMNFLTLYFTCIKKIKTK